MGDERTVMIMRLIDADKMNLLLGISDRDIYAKWMLDHMKLLFGTGLVQSEREKKVQRLRARLDAQARSTQKRSIPWEAD